MLPLRYRCALVALIALVALPAASDAAELTLRFLNSGVTVVDNGTGDTDAATGRIINNVDVSGFGIAITVLASNKPGVASSGGLLQVQSLSIRNNNANPATLVLEVTDDGFTLPGGNGSVLDLTSSAAGSFTFGGPGDSLAFQSFVNPANGSPLPPLAPSAAALNFTRGAGAFQEPFTASSATTFTRGSGPYALGARLSTTLSPGAQLSVSGSTLAVVPEPTGVAVGGWVIGHLLVKRRRRRAA